MDVEAQKQRAAERALDYVRDGMTIGLGTGSTAASFVDLVGVRVKAGLNVLCVPTSQATRVQAEGLNIPLSTLDALERLDLTVDGADELDGGLRLIKGGGGALLREKIVAAASERMVVIADAGKRVAELGAFPLPVEVDPFGWRSTCRLVLAAIEEAGCAGDAELRHTSDAEAFVSDGGNYILDCALGRIPDPGRLASRLSAVPGVVEHGLFIGLADAAVIANEKDVEIIGEAP